jgi:lysozyme
MDRERLRGQLMLHEGLRRFPYTDTVGKLTIGVGRNLTDVGLSASESMFLLDNDIEECLKDLSTFPWFDGLGDVRQRVIVDMRFNLGPNKFRGFKNTLAAVARGDYHAAATGMSRSLWARQVGRRAVRLATMMRTGEDG